MVFSATYLLLWAIAIFQGLAICALARQVHTLSQRSDKAKVDAGLPIGTTAPEFQAIDLRTGQAARNNAFAGRRTMILFLSTDCGVCKKVAAELEGKVIGGATRLAIYCDGSRRACSQRLAGMDKGIALLGRSAEDLPALFRVPDLPYAVLIDSSWRIEGHIAGRELQSQEWFGQAFKVAAANDHSETPPQGRFVADRASAEP